MLATVPLGTPVKTVNSARALAESVALAGEDAYLGDAVARIVRFLHALPYPALRAHGEGVLDVLHLLGAARAAWATDWLARHGQDLDTRSYWSELCEISLLG